MLAVFFVKLAILVITFAKWTSSYTWYLSKDTQVIATCYCAERQA